MDKDAAQVKVFIQAPSENVLYMAELVKEVNASQHFVILTTAANPSVSEIHHRMPLVLKREQLSDWLNDVDSAREMLAAAPPMLVHTAC